MRREAFENIKYLQRGAKSTDLLRYIILDKFSRSFFFGLRYIEQQTHFYNYSRLIISVRTRLSPLAVSFFYTGIVEDRLIARCRVSLDKLSAEPAVNRLFFNFLAIFVNTG